MRQILSALILFGFWLALSGHYEWWLLAFGASLSIIVIAFCYGKQIADPEGAPYGMIPRGVVYWPWLVWQIILSGLRVSRLILDPKLPISPTLVKVDAKQNTAVGLVSYANSITLTPGTISIEASEKGRCIWVHAIEKSGAEGFADDEMNRKVAWFERGRL